VNGVNALPMIWSSDWNVQRYQPNTVSELSWNRPGEQVIRKSPIRRNQVSRQSSGEWSGWCHHIHCLEGKEPSQLSRNRRANLVGVEFPVRYGSVPYDSVTRRGENATYKVWRFVSKPICVGIEPEIVLTLVLRYVRRSNPPMVVGICPDAPENEMSLQQ